MKTQALIDLLTKSLADNGDREVVISTTGDKSHKIVRIAKGTTTDIFKDKEPVIVIASSYKPKKKE